MYIVKMEEEGDDGHKIRRRRRMFKERENLTFRILETTTLDVVAGRETKSCFFGARFGFRDSDFDKWLPVNQPRTDICSISTLSPSRDATFTEWAITIIGARSAPTELGKCIKSNGYAVTLGQIDRILEGLEQRGQHRMGPPHFLGRFFFVENEKNSPLGEISVVGIYRGESNWLAHIYELEYHPRWDADEQLLIRNLKLLNPALTF